MIKTLFHSIIVNKRCNLACEYCDAVNHKFISHLDEIKDKGNTLKKTIERYNSLFSAEVLEMIGGGEIFVERGVDKWIEPITKYYDHIEIVTNGLNIPFDEINNINNMASFSLAVSLDGYTYDMCRSRFSKYNQFEAVFNNVQKLLDSNVYIELRAVLNKNNAGYMMEFLEFLLPYKEKIALQISPVKDKIPNFTSRQDFNAAYISCLDNIINNHGRYKEFIAPLQYFKILKEYYVNKTKPTQCFIPYFKMLTLIDGKQAACSVNWIKEMADLYNIEEGMDYFKQDIFKLMNRKKPVLSTCIHDYGDSDIYNLYMLDHIELEDLSYFVLYTRPNIKERIRYLKKIYRSNI